MPRQVEGEKFRFEYMMCKLLTNSILRMEPAGLILATIPIYCKYFSGKLTDEDKEN
jgi:hypothetical protein